MKILRLSDPKDYEFARASRVGTWSESTTLPQHRIQPLVIEWEPGSDRIGDFVWPGFDSDVAVNESVAKKLLHAFSGFELGSVEMVQDKKLKKPKRVTVANRRVWLPYEGPVLYDLWITNWVNIDLDRSSVIESKPGV